MKKVDKLFKNATVLTVDEKFNQFPNGAVAVSGDAIVAVGPEEETANNTKLPKFSTATARFSCLALSTGIPMFR